ncbi:uncharacterized protein At3g60930, chloroplastic-like [Eutrema salsugineum]|uniref:uncharacterized protein At3g60930, chloroplastic-like n=1 Tax=Eutrema salsugineum TaxID=72664 RepID=UPI000CED55B4|nr:uncharacterized protein At3g60930, chloroplastic-like [Eutrema salsugineum]
MEASLTRPLTWVQTTVGNKAWQASLCCHGEIITVSRPDRGKKMSDVQGSGFATISCHGKKMWPRQRNERCPRLGICHEVQDTGSEPGRGTANGAQLWFGLCHGGNDTRWKLSRGVSGSSEASVSPSPSHRSSESNEASNRSNPSGARSLDDKSSVSTSRPQGLALDDDVNHAAVKAKEEAFPFDLFEAKRELERLMASRGASSSGRGKRAKRQKPDPPGSTLSSPDSLEALRCCFGISEAVKFVLPEKTDQADKPPENHFTLYETFFELCFLWFPIPGVILEYLWKHGISIGQIMPRGLPHMIGILKAPKGDRFYISNKSNRRIIGGFPRKDQFWTERFFYVLVNEASVGDDYFGTFFPRFPTTSLLFEILLRLREHKKRREEEEAARRAAEATQTKTEAIPQTDPPSREGEGTVRGAEANVAKASDKETAAEVEPGEIIPEAPKDDSAARSKTPSNSAILALPKSSRPPTSVVQKHDPSRKCSAADKGKGVAIQKDEPYKKKRKPAPGDPAARKLVVDNPDASAVMFARVNNANTRLPPPEKLRRPRSYGAMAQRGTKARNETAEAKGKLDEAMTRVSRLEEEKIVLRADVDKVSASVIRLEEARRAKSAEVALLKRRIAAKDALFNAKVKHAKKEVRRELTAKFQERLAKVEEGLAKLEKAKTDENELGQIKGNLAMIAVLKKPNAPTLDDEEAQLKS